MISIKGLANFLKERREKIVRKERTNVVYTTVGYSEYTQWHTTKSFDEVEVVDFDLLMEQIEEFEKSFKEDKNVTNEDGPHGSPKEICG
jgi:anaerobic ribonucleoside-triphosphate reductase